MEEEDMGRECSMYGCKEELYNILIGEQDGNIPLGGHKLRQEDNIKMDLRYNWVV
jgi:hypothetical protein